MYNADLVRQLCKEIADEKDPEKTHDLLLLLQSVIKEDLEDIRRRMAFLAKKYPIAESKSQAAD
ncbi:MAG TPA: hypothetical protein VNZ03_31055 [Terriglobales bacterium]|nr:hypothetical protein [Terriglobales bacterium]